MEEQPEIALLVNNAGCGYLGNIGEIDTVSQTRMIDLNLRALTAITNLSVPYMEAGSRILNVSSIASFCPTPRMTVYSATKAYVSAYTIGAAEELKAKGITVTAVCPGPMATEFLAVGHVVDSRPFELLPYCDQVQVAGGALRAARAGQTIYTPRLFYKFYRLLAKLTPAKLMVKLTKNLSKLSRNCNTFRYRNVLQFVQISKFRVHYFTNQRSVCGTKRGGAMERMKFSPEGENGMSDICSKAQLRPTVFINQRSVCGTKEEEQWNG